MTRAKFLNFLRGFHIIAVSENTSKYDISDSNHGVPLKQIWMPQADNFPERTPPLFFVELGRLF